MKILDFDCGNTRLKWRFLLKGEIVQSGVINNTDCYSSMLRCVADTLHDKPDRSRMSSVRAVEINDIIVAKVFDLWGVRVERPVKQEVLAGVRLADIDLSTYGEDRWLGLLAARAAMPDCPLVVVDSGTALTLDIIDAEGCFKGGFVVPGINLMLKSLADNADGLMIPDQPCFRRQLGMKTVEAMQFGVVSMMAALIEKEYEFLGGNAVVVLGGADAAVLADLVTIPVLHLPGLIFDGLAIALI
ncbi:MAG: type III pantothenate kinase [Endozoicomonadaceae bacterium]|nr:type III pantothenate kinase [Endozoicomonadaceae bacterium]